MQNDAYLSTWKTYQSAWSERTTAQRLALLERSVAEDCLYSDPTGLCRGRTELLERIERTQERFPGASFENTAFASHHDQGLSHWTMHASDGETIAAGISYARFREDGRLTVMTGFFDAAAAYAR